MKSTFETITAEQNKLVNHPVYLELNSLKNLRVFMAHHVFAVWDFMSLLKSLQRQITCVTVPWKPSVYSAETVRLINQIVLGEESDLDLNGDATSHFELYLRAMEEVGADTDLINKFLHIPDLNLVPEGCRQFVEGNLQLAHTGHVVEVAAAFFFGREKLIPEMFIAIKKVLEAEKIEAPTLLYYLQRHIELDGEEHGPMALNCLNDLTKSDSHLERMALETGLNSLKSRGLLWDQVLKALSSK